MENINKNIATVLASIRCAYARRKHDNGGVHLVAVSKNHPYSSVQIAKASGLKIFGESRIQEVRDKYKSNDANIELHMIGHLQTNKAKYAVKYFDVIQSVDSERLLIALNVEAAKIGKVQDILVQVNTADEVGKFGASCASSEDLLFIASTLGNIRVRGLMTITPFYDEPESARADFARTYELYCAARIKFNQPDFNILSMGMSGDYAIAIEEGANYVRVGTAIFGERQY